MMTTDTNLPIKIDLYQAAPGAGGTIKPDRRSGSLSQQEFADFRIRSCHIILEEGTYIIIPNTKKKSSNCQFQLRVASDFQIELNSLD